MNRDSVIDCLSYILFRSIGIIARGLPKGFSFFLGRRLGSLLYYFDLKHKAVAYANIKTAFGSNLEPFELNRLTHRFYQAFGQNLMEMFFIPLVDKEYLNKYITIEGLHNVGLGAKLGKGIIFLGVHEGSWEFSSVISANLGISLCLLVAGQRRYRRLEGLLNSYRMQKGCKLIDRDRQVRGLIEALRNNEAVGMTLDQGGRDGELVKFFGKDASMATGAVQLALKYNAAIIPVFYTRQHGAHIKLILNSLFELNRTGDNQKDIRENLQRLTAIFENYIRQFPQEYLWTYKIWKYASQRSILILSDEKAGHLRQAQTVARIASGYLAEKAINVSLNIQEVRFKNSLAKNALCLGSAFSGKYRCQGCLWCLRSFLRSDVYEQLISFKPDVIISCGSSLAPVNFVLSRENLSKSIVIMRPSVLSTNRFDLVIMPKHDNPPKRKNIVTTEGALNLIDEQYLQEQSVRLLKAEGSRLKAEGFYIGLLIGGNTKNFHLDAGKISEVIKQVKLSAEKLDADILLTTSRRTPKHIEELVKEEFKDYPRCKLLVVANEKNIPEAVGGILGLSKFLVCSLESISMICEAVNSKKYTLVFNSKGLSRKHQRFLAYFARHRYIYLVNSSVLCSTIEDIWLNKPQGCALKDNLVVKEAIKRVL